MKKHNFDAICRHFDVKLFCLVPTADVVAVHHRAPQGQNQRTAYTLLYLKRFFWNFRISGEKMSKFVRNFKFAQKIKIVNFDGILAENQKISCVCEFFLQPG